jgi:hypothetical protein
MSCEPGLLARHQISVIFKIIDGRCGLTPAGTFFIIALVATVIGVNFHFDSNRAIAICGPTVEAVYEDVMESGGRFQSSPLWHWIRRRREPARFRSLFQPTFKVSLGRIFIRLPCWKRAD